MYIYSRAFYVSRGTSALESAVFAHPTGWVKAGGYGTGGAVQEGVCNSFFLLDKICVILRCFIVCVAHVDSSIEKLVVCALKVEMFPAAFNLIH